MIYSLEVLIVLVAALLTFGTVISKVAVRFGVPILVALLFIGMAMGSEGVGGIYFDYPKFTQGIGIIALVFILYSGGLETEWRSVRPVLKEGLLLATLGVLITALAVGLFAHLTLGFSLNEGILLGATIASTDAAAVFSILRGGNIYLPARLKSILELESGSNDPMAVFLALGMLQLLSTPGQTYSDLIPLFILQMAVGALLGFVLGQALRWLINHIRLEYDGLYPVLSVGMVLIIYGVTTLAEGNGFLAIYVAGLTVGNSNLIHKRSLCHFHDGLSWLMQITVFLILGLQVYPSRLLEVAPMGLLLAVFLMLIARPLSVFISTLPTHLTLNEKTYISWVGLRGAAPVILATFTQLSPVQFPVAIFDLVFFVVLVSITVQGATIVPMAKWLGLLVPQGPPAPSLRAQIADPLASCLTEITVAPQSQAVGKQLIELGLPATALVVLVGRGNERIIPRGGTVIQAHDQLLIVTEELHQGQVLGCFDPKPA
jgi:cell volume regulation protein A